MRPALQRFIRRLRDRGLEVSPGEHLDALAALELLAWEDQRAFREALRATLVKRADHNPLFDAEFARFFATPPLPALDPKGKRGAGGAKPTGHGQARGKSPSGQGLRPSQAPQGLPSPASTHHADEPSPGPAPSPEPLDEARSTAAEQPGHGPSPQPSSELEAPLPGSRVTFHSERAPAEPRSRQALLSAPFRSLSPEEVADLRRHVRLLAARLASRLSRRRRQSRRGAVDLKHTVRLSLTTGGVPFRLAHRARRVDHPDIVALCDVSGSVLRAADLMLEFLDALRHIGGRIRVFGYTNRMAELTGLWDPRRGDLRGALPASGLDLQAFSDFGGACYDMLTRLPGALTRHTNLLVMGDARNNYGDAMTWAFRDLTAPARRVVWLVPEARERWNTGDSQIGQYAPLCDGVFECHSLERLLRALQRIT